MRCINCGKNTAREISQGSFVCDNCKHQWTLEDEKGNLAFVRTVLGRDPYAVERPNLSVIPAGDVAPVADDLASLASIGATYAKRLADAGIVSFAQIAMMPQSDLKAILGAKMKDATIENIILEASEKAAKG